MLPRHSHTCPLQVFTSRPLLNSFALLEVKAHNGGCALPLATEDLNPLALGNLSRGIEKWWPSCRAVGMWDVGSVLPHRIHQSLQLLPLDTLRQIQHLCSFHGIHLKISWIMRTWIWNDQKRNDSSLHCKISSMQKLFQSVGLRDVANPHLPCRILSRSCVIKKHAMRQACENQLLTPEKWIQGFPPNSPPSNCFCRCLMHPHPRPFCWI